MLTRRSFLTSVTLAGAFGSLELALAQVPVPRPPREGGVVDTRQLGPGGFSWYPELSPEGPVVIIVSLPDQLVHVYRNGIEIAVSTCSTGKPGHATPTGVFVVLQKDRDHRSSTYNNAPMPNMQRLTWSGIALHAGNLPGYPASHGCVRLPRRFSELVFEITHLGIPVIIADAKSEPQSVVHPGLLLPAEAAAEAHEAVAEAARKDHHATSATADSHDVVSMVVSGHDREAVLFLDGVEVWRSAIRIRDAGTPLGNHVFKLLPARPGETHFTWLAHPIAAVRESIAEAEGVLSRLQVVDWAGAAEILSNFRPGSTLVVTDVATGAHTRSGPDFVILGDA